MNVMIEFKSILGLVSVVLSLVGYIPYIKDTINGKTRPHVYSWFLWGFETAIAYALQIYNKAGAGSWVTITVVFVCFFIFILGLKNGKKDITRSDTLFFILALISLMVWLIAKQPTISVILISVTSLLGFVPTIRKSLQDPNSETLSSWIINTFRHGISILALQNYNLTTWLYPGVWVVANGLFSLLIIYKRKYK